MQPRPRFQPLRALGLSVASLLLCACGAGKYFVTVRTEPSASDIYVNGRHVGQGPEKVVEFDFAEGQRVFLQVSCKGRSPSLDIFTEDTLPANLEKRVNLR